MVAIGWIKLQTKLNIAFYDIFSKLSEYAHETESFGHLQTLKIIYVQLVIIDYFYTGKFRASLKILSI